MAGSKVSVTIDGVGYPSRTQAAKALVAAGKTLKEAAKALEDAGAPMTYQTIYANTAGADKVAVRRQRYRILNLGKSGRRTAGEIAKKVGVSTSKVVAMLKKEGIAIVTKEGRERAKAEKKASKKTKKVDAIDMNTLEAVEDDVEVPADVEAEAEMVRAIAEADMVDEENNN